MSGTLLQMSGIVVDLVHRVDRLPRQGEDVEATALAVTPGGGFNAMVAARRFGMAVAYGGALGTGRLADIVRAALEAHGIPALMEGRRAIDQGSCVVLVDRQGERSFVSHHGAERDIDRASLDRVPAPSCAWVLLTGYSLFKEEGASHFARWLGRLPRGPRLLFDPGPMVAAMSDSHRAAALARADWVSANADEARALTALADPEASVRALARGRDGALVRMGADGCWLATAEGAVERVAGLAVAAIDTTGAGDTHDGAFIAALARGYGPRDAAVLANAAAAISTTRAGPAVSPTFEETVAFLRARGIAIG